MDKYTSYTSGMPTSLAQHPSVFKSPTTRKAKILATMGPALEAPGVLESVLKAGVDAVRINFSHGSPEQHTRYVQLVRDTSWRLGRPCALLADLMGPKIRVDAQTYDLKEGEAVSIKGGKGDPDKSRIGISFRGLAKLVKPGQRVLLDDGKLALSVVRTHGEETHCKVEAGGTLKPRKSVNVPGVDLPLPILSKKDKQDLTLIAKLGFDWVAASFVRDVRDIQTIRRAMQGLKMQIPLVSKIECVQAVHNLRSIVETSDGIMVARGDLGVELDLELIPTVQRNAVHLGRELGKLTIIATQMLETMTDSPRPTRAEVTDVSTAALSRVDTLMLSGETAAGKFPIATVGMMDRIIRVAERNLEEDIVSVDHTEPIALICEAGMYLALSCAAAAVVTVSTFGSTPRMLSTYRAGIPIVAACTTPEVYQRSALYRGVVPLLIDHVTETEAVFRLIEHRLKAMGLARVGESLIFVFGFPIHGKNRTNTIRRWVVT
jgi:pyruvate kinase